jgi:hypothetical protein
MEKINPLNLSFLSKLLVLALILWSSNFFHCQKFKIFNQFLANFEINYLLFLTYTRTIIHNLNLNCIFVKIIQFYHDFSILSEFYRISNKINKNLLKSVFVIVNKLIF